MVASRQVLKQYGCVSAKADEQCSPCEYVEMLKTRVDELGDEPNVKWWWRKKVSIVEARQRERERDFREGEA